MAEAHIINSANGTKRLGGGLAREKSINNIRTQMFRIFEQYYRENPERVKKAEAIANRYQQNIEGTDLFAFDELPIEQRRQEAVAEARRHGYNTAEEANKDKSLVRKYGRFNSPWRVYSQGFDARFPSEIPGRYSRTYPRKVYAKKNR